MSYGYVYILANLGGRFPVLYTGVTSDLEQRMWQHRTATTGFVSRYNVRTLVHLEVIGAIDDAIAREKRIKGWTRAKKIALIREHNPTWRNLEKHGSREPEGVLRPSSSE
jgi:putative endonuclease